MQGASKPSHIGSTPVRAYFQLRLTPAPVAKLVAAAVFKTAVWTDVSGSNPARSIYLSKPARIQCKWLSKNIPNALLANCYKLARQVNNRSSMLLLTES